MEVKLEFCSRERRPSFYPKGSLRVLCASRGSIHGVKVWLRLYRRPISKGHRDGLCPSLGCSKKRTDEALLGLEVA